MSSEMTNPDVRFSVIGLDHDHVYGLVPTLLAAGGTLVSFCTTSTGELQDGLAAKFAERFPQAVRMDGREQILADESIQLIVTSGVPSERAGIGIDSMRHGKDCLSDKPGFTTLEQVAEVERVHRETGHVYWVAFGRVGSRATHRAGELVKAGAIGRPVQVMGLGPHRIKEAERPQWFFERERYGGIITDLGSHVADQFVFFTGARAPEVAYAQVANFNHPQYPELEDFGEAAFRAEDGASGYLRVDWFTPDGLETFGDQRLFVLGTDGYLEVRGTVDIAGRPKGGHLFLADHKSVQYVDCTDVELPFGRQLLDDVVNRTQTAMTQEHCLRVSTLTLEAEEIAGRSFKPGS